MLTRGQSIGVIAASVAVLLAGGCVVAGVVPPARAEVGTIVRGSAAGPASGVRAAVGAHWASGTLRRDVPFDVGGGVVFEQRGPAEAATSPVKMSPSVEPDEHQWSTGGYLEGARLLNRKGPHRTWVSVRAEALFDETSRPSLGAGVRLAWELFHAGEGAGADGDGSTFVMGATRGTSAIGVYVEAGARAAGGGPEVTATGGLTVRLPLIAFLGIGCP